MFFFFKQKTAYEIACVDREPRSRCAADDGCDREQVQEHRTVRRERCEAATRNPGEVVGEDGDAESRRVEPGEIVGRDPRLDSLDRGRRGRRAERLPLTPLPSRLGRKPVAPSPRNGIVPAEDRDNAFGPDPLKLVTGGRVSICVDEEVNAVVGRRISEHPASRRREQIQRVAIHEACVVDNRHVRIGRDGCCVELRNGRPVAERPVDRDRRRGPRDRNEQEAGDQDCEERGGPDGDVPDPLRRRGNPNLFSSGSDRPRAADRSVDPPLLAHQSVHATRGRHQAVDPTDSVHEAVRATEPVDEAIHTTSAVDEAVDLPRPARRRLRTRSANQPLAPAHPAGQESDGRRNGRGLGRGFRLVSFLRGRRTDRRVHAHRLFEFFDKPIEYRGLRELELLGGEGLLQLADEEVVDQDIQLVRPGRGPLRRRLRGSAGQTSAARRTQRDVPRDLGTATWTRGSGLRDEMVELRDLLVPRDVVEQRTRGRSKLLGRVRLAKFLRLDPQLRNLDLSFVRSGGGGPVECLDRLVGPTHRLQEQTAGVEQVRVLRLLGQGGVVEIQESRIAFGGELLADRLVHLFFVERGAAFETGGRERRRDATAQGTLVLVLRDRFLRPPRRSVLDEMEGREHLAGSDRPDLRDPRKLVDRCPRDLPERIVPAVDQRLGPRRIEAEDLQQMDEGGRVGLPIDPSLRTARGSRDRLRLNLKVRGWGRLLGRGSPKPRVALVADELPAIPCPALGTRGLVLELPGLSQDRRGAARLAEDEGEHFPAAGAARAEVLDVLRHGRTSHRGAAEPRRGKERRLWLTRNRATILGACALRLYRRLWTFARCYHRGQEVNGTGRNPVRRVFRPEHGKDGERARSVLETLRDRGRHRSYKGGTGRGRDARRETERHPDRRGPATGHRTVPA